MIVGFRWRRVTKVRESARNPAKTRAAARRRVLIRADSGGGTHGFLEWLARRRLQFSAGFTITDDMQPAIMRLPAAAWTPAYDGAGRVRDGAWVAELTG